MLAKFEKTFVAQTAKDCAMSIEDVTKIYKEYQGDEFYFELEKHIADRSKTKEK